MTERHVTVPPEAAGQRLDQFLVSELGVSRARVQWLIESGRAVLQPASEPRAALKPSLKLRGGERLLVRGEAEARPLRAEAEDIPLEIVYEDADLAVVNKPAGMMVHAGAAAPDPTAEESGEQDAADARSRGTLVNALLHHMQQLSAAGGELRPGIVHRLDKQTSGLILVAKNDTAHARLSEMFARRQVRKTYLALVHGAMAGESGTVNAPISRDAVRRIRMTTRREGGRTAISHWKVLRRVRSAFGQFTLVSVRIETGRTHQIRVHLSSVGHPIVGDTLYGAPAAIPLAAEGQRRRGAHVALPSLSLPRNFLHAAELAFSHPATDKPLEFISELPPELALFLDQLSTGETRPRAEREPGKRPAGTAEPFA